MLTLAIIMPVMQGVTKTDGTFQVTQSSFMHTNGCKPGRAQLNVGKAARGDRTRFTEVAAAFVECRASVASMKYVHDDLYRTPILQKFKCQYMCHNSECFVCSKVMAPAEGALPVAITTYLFPLCIVIFDVC
mgnify:CR=1 FL=1